MYNRIATAAIASALLVTAGCGSDDKKAEPVSSSGSPSATAQPTGSATTATSSPRPVKQRTVKVKFRGKKYRYSLTTCKSGNGESDVELLATGTGEGTLSISAKDMKGTIQASGAAVRGGNLDMEGQVTSVMVGDTGKLIIKGRGSIADDSANEGGKFRVKGWCV